MLGPQGFAFNRTRSAYLATKLSVAGTHWSRFVGLMGADRETFPAGHGLWITPSHGIHTFGMRFPIDVAYLDAGKAVVYMAHDLKPWRMAPVRMKTDSVIELPGNTLASTGTAIGDEIEITLGKTPEQKIA
jgi:uncharacterized membrane protein (UPF0127 family)